MSAREPVRGRRAVATLSRAALVLFLCWLWGPFFAGHRLAAQDSRVEVLVLSPEPGERLEPDAVLVAASFVDPGRLLDASSIVLEVDGRNVTAEAEVSPEVVTWVPRTPLAQGPHRVQLRARQRDGAPVGPLNWAFTVVVPAVAAEAARPEGRAVRPPSALVEGSIVFDGAAQSVVGPGAEFRRNEDVLPRLWLNAGGVIAPGWRYALRIHLSGYESSARQPVNRYRFDLRSEHLDASVGDLNPALQELIVSGLRVRGFQGDLRAGPARLTVVWGESRRAIPGLLDPADPTQIARTGTFGQRFFAVRPALGSGRTFQAALTLLRVRDEVTSIPALRTEPAPGTGTTRSANPPPKDNIVVGADVTVRFLRGRALVQYENAFSLLANDITGGPLTGAELDSILESAGYEPPGIDPARYERYFTINGSLIPLDPRGLTSLAQQFRASLRTGPNTLSAEWRSVGGSYYTLGYPVLQRDREGVRLRDAFTLFNDALAVSAGFEQDRDNLDGLKPATTTYRTLFATLSWQPSARSPALVASVRHGTRVNGLAPGEEGALDERSRAVSLGSSVPVELVSGVRTRLNLNVSLTDRDDPANPVNGSRDRYYLGGVDAEAENRGTEATLLYGLNRSTLTGFEDARTDFYRVVANLRQRLGARLRGMLDATYTAARSPEASGELGLEYDRLELLVGGEWEWAPSAFVVVSGGVISYSDARSPERDTRERVVRIRLNRLF